MSRSKGIYPFPVNFELEAAAPLDAKTLCSSVSALTATSTWQTVGNIGNANVYKGMIVSVFDDPILSNNTIWTLTTSGVGYQDINNWKKILPIDEIESGFVSITGDMMTGSLSVYNANIDIIDPTRPSSYNNYSNNSLTIGSAYISGGKNNFAQGQQAIIVNIEDTHSNFAVGTWAYITSGDQNAVLGGSYNYIIGPDSRTNNPLLANTIIGGNNNRIRDSYYSGIYGSTYCEISSAASSVIIGSNHSTSVPEGPTVGNTYRNVIIGGEFGTAYNNGQVVFPVSDGQQCSRYTIHCFTTSTTLTAVMDTARFPGLSSGRIYLKNNSVNMIDIKVLAREGINGNSGTGTNIGAFNRRYIVQNLNNQLSIIGGVQTIGTDMGSTNGNPPDGWSVTPDIYPNENRLKILVQQNNSNLAGVTWVGSLEVIEIF